VNCGIFFFLLVFLVVVVALTLVPRLLALRAEIFVVVVVSDVS
jgi:hypothetical protein